MAAVGFTGDRIRGVETFEEVEASKEEYEDENTLEGYSAVACALGVYGDT
jgi:hypothetical protein